MTKCVIVDIDGTLTDTAHRAHHLQKKPKDWKAFNAAMHLDAPNLIIIDMVNALWFAGYDIVLCSGRERANETITKEWLKQHGVDYDALFMRPTGDYRDDVLVKRELLEQIKAAGYSPQFAIDDRTKVVNDCWRNAGLICLQAAPGDF